MHASMYSHKGCVHVHVHLHVRTSMRLLSRSIACRPTHRCVGARVYHHHTTVRRRHQRRGRRRGREGRRFLIVVSTITITTTTAAVAVAVVPQLFGHVKQPLSSGLDGGEHTVGALGVGAAASGSRGSRKGE